MNDTILLDIDPRGVARLTLNRPERHNAFDDALIAGLSAALEELGEDPRVRAVVLTGAGRSFSAGADLDWMRRMARSSRCAPPARTDGAAWPRRCSSTSLPRPRAASTGG